MSLKGNILIIAILLLVCIAMSLMHGSTAFLANNSQGSPDTQVSVNSCASINFDDSSNSILLEKAYPVSDSIGKSENPYNFNITNNCESETEVTIFFVVNDTSTINSNFIKTYLSENNEDGVIQNITDNNEAIFDYDFNNQYNSITSSVASEVYILGTFKVSGNEKKFFSLNIWLDIEAGNEEAKKIFSGTIVATDNSSKTNSSVNPDLCNSDSVFEESTIQNQIIKNAGGVNCSDPNFSFTSKTNEGIFQTTDVYGPTYYFRGAAEDNWVYFAGFYWRIIRINGDGSIKMIYSGDVEPSEETKVIHGQSAQLTDKSEFNFLNSSAYYIGYTYVADSFENPSTKGSGDSTIKGVLESWYETNIENAGLSKYVEDTAYCGDRTSYSDEAGLTVNSSYSSSIQYFKYYIDLYTNKTPSLICNSKLDNYTVLDTEIGNGALKYPVSLIDANEVSYAGGAYGVSNSNYYLYTGSWYWTITPFCNYSAGINVGQVHSTGILSNYAVTDIGGVRPTISLSSNINILGDGSWDNPYKLEN